MSSNTQLVQRKHHTLEPQVIDRPPSFIVDEEVADAPDPFKHARRLYTEEEAPEHFSIARQLQLRIRRDTAEYNKLAARLEYIKARMSILNVNIQVSQEQLKFMANIYDLESTLEELAKEDTNSTSQE